MKTVLFAYHDIGCEAIRALRELKVEIAAVYTHRADPGENLWFGSVENLARELNIPVFTPDNINTKEWIKKIARIKPDIIFSFYFRQMISAEILELAPLGALNLHGSLLPRYRGRAPVNWVLVKGEKETGLTLHYMVAKADAGDIVAQKRVAITDDDTALTLYKKLIPQVRPLLLETVPLLIAGKAQRIPQDARISSYFGGRKPEDGKIDWTRSTEEIYNLIRAVTHPYPGAFTTVAGQKIFIWKAHKVSADIKVHGSPGTVSSIHPLQIVCAQGCLEIETIQTDGEAEMSGPEWSTKNLIHIGSTLGGY